MLDSPKSPKPKFSISEDGILVICLAVLATVIGTAVVYAFGARGFWEQLLACSAAVVFVAMLMVMRPVYMSPKP